MTEKEVLINVGEDKFYLEAEKEFIGVLLWM